MFTINEHHALLRLMRVSMGGVSDSKPIAHWLQQWDRMNDPASLTALQADLVFSRARDVEEITLAAKRTGAKPSTLGRREYENFMEIIARSYPLLSQELER